MFSVSALSRGRGYASLNLDQFRECQTEDWKKGRPTPHKIFCGKLKNKLSEAASPSPQPGTGISEFARAAVPDPDPSYKRSPALVYQASLLQQPYYEDYFVSKRYSRYLNMSSNIIDR